MGTWNWIDELQTYIGIAGSLHIAQVSGIVFFVILDPWQFPPPPAPSLPFYFVPSPQKDKRLHEAKTQIVYSKCPFGLRTVFRRCRWTFHRRQTTSDRRVLSRRHKWHSYLCDQIIRFFFLCWKDPSKRQSDRFNNINYWSKNYHKTSTVRKKIQFTIHNSQQQSSQSPVSICQNKSKLSSADHTKRRSIAVTHKQGSTFFTVCCSCFGLKHSLHSISHSSIYTWV